LSGDVDIDINSEILDVDMDLAIDCEEKVLVMEVTIGGSGHLDCIEVGTVVSMVEFNIDIVKFGLRDLNDKVLEITSIEVDLWDCDVLEEFEEVWSDDILGFTDTILGD